MDSIWAGSGVAFHQQICGVSLVSISPCFLSPSLYSKWVVGLFVSQPFAAWLWTCKRLERQISGSRYRAGLRRTVQVVSRKQATGLLSSHITSAFLTFNGFCTLARTEWCLRLWNTSVLRDYCYQRLEAICLETHVFSARRKCTLERSAFHNFDKLPHYHTWLRMKSAAWINAVKSHQLQRTKYVHVRYWYSETLSDHIFPGRFIYKLFNPFEPRMCSFVISAFPQSWFREKFVRIKVKAIWLNFIQSHPESYENVQTLISGP